MNNYFKPEGTPETSKAESEVSLLRAEVKALKEMINKYIGTENTPSATDTEEMED